LSRVATLTRAAACLFGKYKATFRPTEAGYQNYEKLVTQNRQLLIATRGVLTEGSRTKIYLEIQPTSSRSRQFHRWGGSVPDRGEGKE